MAETIEEAVERVRKADVWGSKTQAAVISVVAHYDKLAVEVERLKNNLLDVEQAREDHLQHVSEFLSELYGVMVDPCATGTIKVEVMTRELLAAAILHRDNLQSAKAKLSALSETARGAHDVLSRIPTGGPWHRARETLAEALASLDRTVPAEEVLRLPRTPTEQMVEAGLYHSSEDSTSADIRTIWTAMFDAVAMDGGVTDSLPALPAEGEGKAVERTCTCHPAIRQRLPALSPPSQGKPPPCAPYSVTYVPGPDVSGLAEAARVLRLSVISGLVRVTADQIVAACEFVAAFQSRQEGGGSDEALL